MEHGPRPGFSGVGHSPQSLTRVKAPPAFRVYLEPMNERPLIEPGTDKVVSLPQETQFAPNGIVSRTLVRTDNLRTVLFGFAEGQELTEHTSTQQALVQVLSGECEFSLRGKAHKMVAGDFLHMEPNVPHAVKATQSFSMLLILAKPPVSAERPLRTSLKVAVEA